MGMDGMGSHLLKAEHHKVVPARSLIETDHFPAPYQSGLPCRIYSINIVPINRWRRNGQAPYLQPLHVGHTVPHVPRAHEHAQRSWRWLWAGRRWLSNPPPPAQALSSSRAWTNQGCH
jgi:hypothetical protein